MGNADVILWLDLETTGSAWDSDILEVGVALSTADTIEEIAAFTSPVAPRDPRKFLAMDPVVIDMHIKSGLAYEILAEAAPSTVEIENRLLDFLDNNGLDKEHIALAGSGVSHFDRQFIRRDWPLFNKRLTYWAYDVGVVRRTLRLAGFELPSPSEGLRHRALDDARDHAKEFRGYLLWLREARQRDDRGV